MLWQKTRSGVMLVISFVSCPCHLPITLPLVLTLLAGTPAAVWIGNHVGWVYGGMAVLFVVSLGLGLRWILQTNAAREACEPRPARSTKRPSKPA
jgi:mercuric ion transport protein